MTGDVSLLEKLRKEYESISQSADQARLALMERLSNVVGEQGIALPLPAESRLKTWSSIEEKLNRTKLDIRSVLDLQDLVGVRFIGPSASRDRTSLHDNLKTIPVDAPEQSRGSFGR